jgi:membrane peptidoglycan carboxypeptidase
LQHRKVQPRRPIGPRVGAPGRGIAARAIREGHDHPPTPLTARRHAIRRRAGPSPLGGRSILLRIGIAALLVALVMAAIGTVAVVATVQGLSADLPDPSTFEQLAFDQPTVVYDRTGKIELGRFQHEQRRVLAFKDVPKLVIDATTTAEDRSFWQNDGYDPAAIVSAIAGSLAGDGERGASTITQQLVRARMLPRQYLEAGADRYLRKAKEIIQASRLTQAYPGEDGKNRIITAYLNQVFYGHGAYGIAAAAHAYFGVTDLTKLTPAQAALLAGLPKSPTSLDPYAFAKRDSKGRLVVPSSAAPVVRRDWILQNLSTSRWTQLSDSELQAALHEPVVLAGDQPLHYRAPQFVWQVRRQLNDILGGGNNVLSGGYRVVTSLDWQGQQLAEKWLEAAAIVPNVSRARATKLLHSLRIPATDRSWIKALRGKDVHNDALVALDYQTGEVLAYAGSAGYYQDRLASRKFDPKYDVAGDGTRQPGSAWKPILYSTAFDTRRLTPGSLLLDVTTRFGSDWKPKDADSLERGPVLVRRALQYSLNIPAIRALGRTGNGAVAATAQRLGIRFPGGKNSFLQAGLAGAIGTVEVRPLDLTSAYGAIANGGRSVPPRMILEIDGPDGQVVWKAGDPKPKQAISPQAAFLVNDILKGNTNRGINPIWGKVLHLEGPNGAHRPVAAKTGTANDARDLATYGYLAPPKKGSKRPGLAVGVWMGNSDHSFPRAREPAISLTAAAPLWHAFVRDYTRRWPITDFRKPPHIVSATIDAWSGGKPGPWTRATTRELFIAGTQPGARGAIDPPGLLYEPNCGGWQVDPVKAEVGSLAWLPDVRSWTSRARSGVGVRGPYGTRTAYFWGESSWGGPIIGSCHVAKHDKHGPGEGDGGGHGGGHGHKPHGQDATAVDVIAWTDDRSRTGAIAV